jgi:hypothetical protein
MIFPTWFFKNQVQMDRVNRKVSKPQWGQILHEIALELYPCVTIMCRNDELSWLFTKRFRDFFIIFAENSQILFKISVIPILLTLIHLVAHNLLVNNQLNSSSNSTHIIVTLDKSNICYCFSGRRSWKNQNKYSKFKMSKLTWYQGSNPMPLI